MPELAPRLPMLVTQTRCEFVRLWRQPAFSLPSIALPVMFFTLFGLPRLGERIGGVDAGPYLLATFGAVSMTSVMLFSFGVGVAAERGAKVDILMRAAPLPPVVHLVARVLTALAFGVIILSILFAYGGAAGVRQSPVQWVVMAICLLLGALPFLAAGYAIGNAVSAGAAAPIVNLIWAPLSFGSGLFVPLPFLPSVIQQIAPYLPSYRYAQLVLGSVGEAAEPVGECIAWLLAYGVLFTAGALYTTRTDRRRKFA